MRLYSPDEDLEYKSPSFELQRLSDEIGIPITSEEFSKYLDSRDHLSFLRDEFIIPTMKSSPQVDLSLVEDTAPCVYMCGNSLGLQPMKTITAMSQVMNDLAHVGVLQSTDKYVGSVMDEHTISQMARIVGAHPQEITLLNGLTVNLHLLLASFYLPTIQRHKILIESKAFPSDHYVAESQILSHGFCPETSLIQMSPRHGEALICAEDIIDRIQKEGDSISVVLLPGIQYYTGQLFDMENITKAAHSKGCLVGFDLAHAVGNVEIHLHKWDVDFAAWCTYKYLNSGPGNTGAAFVHEKHKNNQFTKSRSTEESSGCHFPYIQDYKISPTCPLLLSNIKCSMEIFSKTTIKELRNKSFYLTGLLECLLKHYFPKKDDNSPSISIITPENFKERGTQLSLVFSVGITQIHEEMTKRGVICDIRKPNVIRVAPAPIYCRFHDVYRFVAILRQSFERTVID